MITLVFCLLEQRPFGEPDHQKPALSPVCVCRNPLYAGWRGRGEGIPMRIFLQQAWRKRGVTAIALYPLSLLYGLAFRIRTGLYSAGILKSTRLPVAVIVIGNLTVGGSGKTPLVIWMAAFLRDRGWRPGIVARGYGGKSTTWPQAVTDKSDPDQVGDEAVLLAGRSGVPVVVAPDRAAAARQLISDHQCDIIISDDGLQHLSLARDIEIEVVREGAGYGNGWLLPAGPLREPPHRAVDFRLVTAGGGQGRVEEGFTVTTEIEGVHQMGDPEAALMPIEKLPAREIHAIAGIGQPEQFFKMLEKRGLTLIRHPFPDHHRFVPEEIPNDGRPVIMTEKDGVKCRPFARPGWYILRISSHPGSSFEEALLARIGQ